MELSNSSIERITNSLLHQLKAQNLILVPNAAVPIAQKFLKERKKALQKECVTIYECVKYNLIDTQPSRQTIKNMIADGRINPSETFVDKKGTRQITIQAIHRLNDTTTAQYPTTNKKGAATTAAPNHKHHAITHDE
jgi:hypothetical protein